MSEYRSPDLTIATISTKKIGPSRADGRSRVVRERSRFLWHEDIPFRTNATLFGHPVDGHESTVAAPSPVGADEAAAFGSAVRTLRPGREIAEHQEIGSAILHEREADALMEALDGIVVLNGQGDPRDASCNSEI